MNILLLCIILSNSLYATDKNFPKINVKRNAEVFFEIKKQDWLMEWASKGIVLDAKDRTLIMPKISSFGEGFNKKSEHNRNIVQSNDYCEENNKPYLIKKESLNSVKKNLLEFMKNDLKILQTESDQVPITITTIKKKQNELHFPIMPGVKKILKTVDMKGYTDLMLHCFWYGASLTSLCYAQNIDEKLFEKTNMMFQNAILNGDFAKKWDTVFTNFSAHLIINQSQVRIEKYILPYNAFMIFFAPFIDGVDGFNCEEDSREIEHYINNILKFNCINCIIDFFDEQVKKLPLKDQIDCYDSLLKAFSWFLSETSSNNNHFQLQNEFDQVFINPRFSIVKFFVENIITKIPEEEQFMNLLLLRKKYIPYGYDLLEERFKERTGHCWTPSYRSKIKTSLLVFRALEKPKKIFIHKLLQGDIIFRATGINPYKMNEFLNQSNLKN